MSTPPGSAGILAGIFRTRAGSAGALAGGIFRPNDSLRSTGIRADTFRPSASL